MPYLQSFQVAEGRAAIAIAAVRASIPEVTGAWHSPMLISVPWLIIRFPVSL